ncbi:leucine--tRNA ligase [Christiangramia fulva]|uniref:Leucine--tRNA ligase n=1 Tax=Christiangramia fulva TaxID=2126553 RepID=A0A2R3ZAW7_9FLAO|nr:leucine--tRNA ligase [Christiangramia fulva]AVR47364.1 leucine--tRNA ligase [Christiangramia fulva]
MSYHFNKIEEKWQKYWAENQTFRASNDSDKEKYYVLDMFPYPSGAGLHVGHPLGYIASDIYARFKRHKGFNVLHPQGYDSFGLPAEQYAIQTGQHPALTTEKNIKRYREQLDKIGFSFDWSREVRTSEPNYYKWTQWIFIQLFESWYDLEAEKSRPVTELEEIFSSEGNTRINAACDDDTESFSAEEWRNFSSEEKQRILLKYRLTYLAETEVNWCPQLGTVLANDEIVNGVSERGGYPVVRKKMTQWSMRISAFAERLLQDLDKIDWTESLKESQRNWIGKSVGAMVEFKVLNSSQPQPFPKGREQTRFTGKKEIAGELLHRAKEMRKNPTSAESLLWEKLRTKKLDAKFRRQHPIDQYIVDFVCLSKKLIVEVDGEIHQFQKAQDEEREDVLVQKLGYHLLRFSNEEVLRDPKKVADQIQEKLNSLSFGEGGGEDNIPPSGARGIKVFTTRPDTIFGVTFMTLAPEHELVPKITTDEQREEVEAYIAATAKRSERDRMADVKTISGVFTGAYAEHPFTKEPVPIWIGDYVLAGYGTGAVMAVPCGDQRDYEFAKHFDLPIRNIFENVDISEEAFAGKEGTVIANSDFLSGLKYKEALNKAILKLEEIGQGYGKTNYRLRDAVFSRQRYWGEPFPVYYVNGLPQMIEKEHLPLRLPEVEKYLPTETGEPPLGNATDWAWDTNQNKVVSNKMLKQGQQDGSDDNGIYPLELNTMPGWAGSSWYLFRYMDPHNEDRFVSEEAQKYWENVDLYIGGSEHATGHLLYSRFWTKFLYDRGWLTVEEPFKKLINQGMILGTSAFVYRLEGENKFISKNLISDKTVQPIHADVSLVNSSDELDIEGFKKWRPEFSDAEFITEEDGIYKVGREVEKMSKSKYNVVNPDDICEDYGADTLRMYEMFLGPLEQAKPWNTAGITGVHSFLKKLWKLYHDGEEFSVSEEKASADSLKTLHKTIKKVTEDIENFSFNTSVSTFMICVNELTAQKCNSKEVLEPLAILIAPYAPHIAEELWEKLGHSESVVYAKYPEYEEKYLVESTKNYPISFNGKMRFTMELPLDMSKDEIEKTVLTDDRTKNQLDGSTPKKIIVVPGKIVNIVV